MRHLLFFLALVAVGAQAQDPATVAPEAVIPDKARKAVRQQQPAVPSFDISIVKGRKSEKRIDFGAAPVILDNVRIEPGVRSSRAKGACRVKLLINDTPLRMSREVIEGTRGQARPIRRVEDGSPPRGLVTTIELPPIYPVLLRPIPAPVALSPKDKLVIQLSSPSKGTDCSAKVDVTTRRAP